MQAPHNLNVNISLITHQTMNMNDIFSIVGTLILSLGGGGGIVFGLSSFLGKVWASRFLEQEKSALQRQYAEHQNELNKSLHQHNVMTTRIDSQRVDAIRDLYGALIIVNEAVIQITSTNDFAKKPLELSPFYTAKYETWASELRKRSKKLEFEAMRTAIYFSEESYRLIAHCGFTASMMSIDFLEATKKDPDIGSPAHLLRVEEGRTLLTEKYSTVYEPARQAVVALFRSTINPSNAKV